MTKVFNVCTKRAYNKQGEEREVWYKVGELKVNEENGHQYLRMFHQPYTEFFVFENDPTHSHLPVIDLDRMDTT